MLQRSQQQREEEEEEGSSTPVATTPPPSSVGKRPRRTAKPLLPAALRGRYELHSLRGQGTFAEVWEARHLRTGHRVAIKIIAPPHSQSCLEVFVMRLLSLRQPQHPHIVRFYEYEAVRSRSGDHTTTYIVMELAEQGQLHDLVAVRERLPEAQARTLFQQLVAGVAYCHRSMVVHRDLKMENVLLDSRGHVKIADFGFSRLWAPGRLQAESCGSPQYAAPELLDGRLYEGPEVDVWSCGVILYVLLVGRLPFDDEYIPTLFKKIAAGNYTIPSYLSPGAVSLIKKMLMVNPVHRITIPELRQDPWFTHDLPAYLEPPTQEFFESGADPNKAIDPKDLAPAAPAPVVQKLHETVVSKLGKTMGYAKHDVQEALARDEPSAIKDAYLIVRENQIMKTNRTFNCIAFKLPSMRSSSPPPSSSH